MIRPAILLVIYVVIEARTKGKGRRESGNWKPV